jgi:hypothetical protein
MSTHGPQFVERVVIASKRDWHDVVDCGGLLAAPYDAALAMIAG